MTGHFANVVAIKHPIYTASLFAELDPHWVPILSGIISMPVFNAWIVRLTCFYFAVVIVAVIIQVFACLHFHSFTHLIIDS